MELEKSFFNKYFRFGYNLYKLRPIKPDPEDFFKEALKKTIEMNELKDKDLVKLIFLYEDINCCTKFCAIEDLDFEYMCKEENFDCIDFNTHICKEGEFKIAIKFVIL